MKNDKLILNDILSKVLTTLERGYMEATMEYHYANDDSALNDVISSHNDFVVFFGKKALITREDRFKTLLKEMLGGINFKLDYLDFVYDRFGNIVNVLLKVKGDKENGNL